jgi:hypothetical protein
MDNFEGKSIKICIHPGCRNLPTFNRINEDYAILCSEHRLPEMVDVVNKTETEPIMEQNPLNEIIKKKKVQKKCQYIGCEKRPSFNISGEDSAILCSAHKMSEMIDVLNKTCIADGCQIHPAFNFKGKKCGSCCSKHKTPEMINVINRSCDFENCKKMPSYNVEGQKSSSRCLEHKTPEMVNVKKKRCNFENCKIYPSFNKENEKMGLRCAEHKEPDMVDVMHKTCNFENCKKQPKFNKDGENVGLRCAEHKEPDMVDVRNNKCNFENCKKQSNFNIKGKSIGLRCFEHKTVDMINVISKTCINEWCYTQIKNKKYEEFCLRCYVDKFPLNTISINYKTKEIAVAEFIKEKFPTHKWVEDKIISGGCSRRRPDLLIYLDDYVIIIEIDENQHMDYDCSNDNTRNLEISKDLNQKPIIFIRFNPDSYKSGGKKITSCWGRTIQGVCEVKKTKETEWNERLNTLKDKVEYWINNKPNDIGETEHLYYDK